MLVYVVSIEGKPLMPCKPAKARKLLKNKKAKIVKYEPFTIQLLFECENQIQECVLGIDAGSKHIGMAVITEQGNVLYRAEAKLRPDIPCNDILEVDHIIPRSKGGSNNPSNLVCSCEAHNKAKSNMEYKRNNCKRKEVVLVG